MDVNEAITGRRAVRDYTAQNVDAPVIRHLIDAALYAPSAGDEQPCTFTVVREQGVLDGISAAAKSYRHTLPDSAQAHGQLSRFQALLADPDFHIFHHAPVLIVISAAAPGPWIIEDCALAAENLMLAAHAAGLGTCWIGFAQGFLNTLEGKKMLGLPGPWVPVAPIVVGHPKAIPPRVPRRQPQVRWIG
ncbi:MAG: nitroreductase family protein [Pollutimonas bauzanensis]